MKTSFNQLNKEWTEIEKYQLWIVGHLNVPLHIVSAWFQRSPNALCKAMARYRIRPSGSVRPGPKSKYKSNTGASPYNIEEILEPTTADSSLRLLKLPPSFSHLPKPLQMSLQRYGLVDNPPWLERTVPQDSSAFEAHAIMSARVDAPRARRPLPGQTAIELKERSRLAKTLAWVSFEDICQDLAKEGITVEKLTPSEQTFSQSGLYKMKGFPRTAAQVVMEANKRRLARGLEPLLVCEVTQ